MGVAQRPGDARGVVGPLVHRGGVAVEDLERGVRVVAVPHRGQVGADLAHRLGVVGHRVHDRIPTACGGRRWRRGRRPSSRTRPCRASRRRRTRPRTRSPRPPGRPACRGSVRPGMEPGVVVVGRAVEVGAGLVVVGAVRRIGAHDQPMPPRAGAAAARAVGGALDVLLVVLVALDRALEQRRDACPARARSPASGSGPPARWSGSSPTICRPWPSMRSPMPLWMSIVPSRDVSRESLAMRVLRVRTACSSVLHPLDVGLGRFARCHVASPSAFPGRLVVR